VSWKNWFQVYQRRRQFRGIKHLRRYHELGKLHRLSRWWHSQRMVRQSIILKTETNAWLVSAMARSLEAGIGAECDTIPLDGRRTTNNDVTKHQQETVVRQTA
jgi:hypothetical protein